ncbi:MAG: flavin reductase family protein [Burkholderiaceae bacterium]
MQAKADHSADFRRALAQFATGVTVVTTRAPDGTPTGLTVNSFASVSLDPPLVLWCLSLKADCIAVFRECERYLIHVLAVDQLDVARRFATRGADKFGPTAWRPTDDGLPRLDGCAAWFECDNRSQYEEGDHVILVGRVEAFQTVGGAPLIFHNARYVSHLVEQPLPPALRALGWPG